ncbi:hypothetical protein V0M98_34910 (plasmid) [Pseudomonas silesiensis]|uniref:hypothetical protein n=1 Tax=Pseudomonas silesiensis TaxID=1853130 RepID=UPI0030D4A16A
MDMTYCPEPSHFFMLHVLESTGNPVILTRAAVNPALEFTDTLTAIQELSVILQEPVNIFTKVFSTIPMDGLRASLQRYLDEVPDELAFETNAHATLDSPEEVALCTAEHATKRAFARMAVLATDAELKPLVEILQIDIQDDEYMLYAGNNEHRFNFIAMPIPVNMLKLSPAELENMQMSTITEEFDESCPYCAEGLPHPEEEAFEPESVTPGQPVKRILH